MGFFKDLFGPRQGCDLCQLGKSSWPHSRSAAADWKVRGDGLHADFFICAPCRGFLKETGLAIKNPMVAMAYVVAGGFADRPPAHAYLQHPAWRNVWMHMLDASGVRVVDEFQALEALKPLEQAFMDHVHEDESPTETDEPRSVAQDLASLAGQFGLAEQYVQTKYSSYLLVLSMHDAEGNWNDEIDDYASDIGALTEDEIVRARTDLHRAVLNRVKVALVSEGAEPIE